MLSVMLALMFAVSLSAQAAERKTTPVAQPAQKGMASKKATNSKKATVAKSKKAKTSKKAKSTRKSARKPTRSKARARKARRHSVTDDLSLRSGVVLVVDQDSGETVAAKNADAVLPIASLTKLMTALVVVEAGLPMNEMLEISRDDVDTEKNTYSRLKVGTRLSRDEMLLLALMSSENRAASALSRHYPGGRSVFLAKMNAKAKALGMNSTHFVEATGLSRYNVSTARDLHRLIGAAYAHPTIRRYSTHTEDTVRVNGRNLTFINSNRLVRNAGESWNIELQKTGFTNEAGRCLVMQTTVLGRRLAMIFLDSTGTMTRYADAARIRKLLEREAKTKPTAASVAVSSAS